MSAGRSPRRLRANRDGIIGFDIRSFKIFRPKREGLDGKENKSLKMGGL